MGATTSGSKYGEFPDFSGREFADEADFRNAHFAQGADFRNAVFRRGADFSGAAFDGTVDFSGARFAGRVTFARTEFARAGYEGTVFQDRCDFYQAIFGGEANFRSAEFHADQGVHFVNAKFLDVTDFSYALFVSPPIFVGATLHEGTLWPGIDWPTPKAPGLGAKRSIIAYERLKMEMDRLKKHDDELTFFARELQSRRVEAGWFPQVAVLSRLGIGHAIPLPGHGLAISLYGLLGGYGRSYVRPLYFLAALCACGTLPIRFFSDGWDIWSAAGLSLANTLGAFGFRKDFFKADDIASLLPAVKMFSAAQTMVGTVLLFLFGLGLRNRFRMK